jgi:hypothetical protein
MSLLDTASLIVTPNGYKEGKLYSVIPSDGSGDMSVTRATTATRVNSAGLVELVPYNLIAYSEDFTNAHWSTYQATINANQTTAPDGTLTADKLNQATGTGGNVVYSSESVTPGAITISAYLKLGTGGNGVVALYDGSWKNAYFNISTGSVVYTDPGVTAYIENAGNGWWRCIVSITTSATSINTNVGHVLNSGQFGYIWGAQLVQGSTAKDYQKTETRLNIPRLDYSNGTCPSLLVEPQRTNAVTYSEFFSTANGYNYQNASQSGSSIVSPSGLLAYGITSTTSASIFHRLFKSVGASSNAFTSSIYAKQGTSRYLGLGVYHNGSASTNNIVVFDLQDGVIASNPYSIAATIELLSNGWYRLTHTYTYTGATAVDICVHNAGVSTYTTSGFQVFDSPTAPTTIYVYGLQFELGSYATSYIPTTSASVTRNADLVTKTSATALIGQTEGTIFGECLVIPQKADSMLCLMRNSSGGLYGDFFFIRASNGVPAVSVRQGDTTYVAINGTTALSEGYHKFAFAYKQNDFAFYVDGVQIGTDTSGNVPTCNEIYLGQYVDGADREVSKKSFALWKQRLTNTQLAQLTTI